MGKGLKTLTGRGLRSQRKLQTWQGPQESFPAGHKHSLKWIPWNPSGTAATSWFFRCEWESSSPPSAVSGDLLSCTTPEPGSALKSPLAQSPSEISTCRAHPAAQGLPGHIQTPELCPSHSTWAQVCSPKLPKPFLSHHPGPARTKPLSQCKAQPDGQLPAPSSSFFSAPGSAAAPTELFQPQAQPPCPSERQEHWDQRKQVPCEDCRASFSSREPKEKQGSAIFSGTSCKGSRAAS